MWLVERHPGGSCQGNDLLGDFKPAVKVTVLGSRVGLLEADPMVCAGPWSGFS